MHPSAALVYLEDATRALSTRNPHLTHEVRAVAAINGSEVPIYGMQPRRARGVGSTRTRAPSTREDDAAHAQSSSAPSIPKCEAWVTEEYLNVVLPEKKAAARSRTIRVPQPPTKPFNNYKKFESARRALGDAAAFVTSAGVYRSAADGRHFEEAAARARSIHAKEFAAVVKNDHTHFDRENAEFAAAGCDPPSDQATSLKKYNTYYNQHMHQFRHPVAKQNVYM